MVHWLYVLVALFVGVVGGLLVSALCVMSADESVQDWMEPPKPGSHGGTD